MQYTRVMMMMSHVKNFGRFCQSLDDLSIVSFFGGGILSPHFVNWHWGLWRIGSFGGRHGKHVHLALCAHGVTTRLVTRHTQSCLNTS